MEIKDSNKDGKIDENDTIKYQNKRIYGKVTSDSDHKIDTSNINSILGSSTSSDIYIDLDNMKIKNASDGTDYAYKPGAPSTFIGKTTASEFKAEVLKAIKLINHKSANAIHSSLVNNYVIKPNIAHTSGDFQFEYDSNNNLYTEDIFGIAISTANIRNPIIQNIINSKTDLMRSNVINHKSANFIKKMKKEILSKFNTNLISKKISSVNIYDSGNAVKVVDSSENNLVDKIVLNSGTGLINSSIGTNASIKLKLDAKMKKFVDSKNAIRPQYYPKINPTNMKYRYDEK
ncbi:MAG: hypothetical protein KAH32_06895 [Chlamydiia bacterium]|nr:hypothetical protein [Chlamydiia bacterium]